MNAINAAILVPVDGSDSSLRALEAAVALAKHLRAEVVVCHVVDLAKAAAMSGGEAQLIEGCCELLQTDGRRIVDEAIERARPQVAVSSRVVTGMPVEAIEQLASKIQPSFIVMGTHGRTGLQRALMGSVAEGVVRSALVPIMVVPPERHHPRITH